MRRRLLYRTLFAVLLIGVGGTSLTACSSKKSKPDAQASGAPKVLTVSTAVVGEQSLLRELLVSGSVVAWDPLPVMPGANGLRIVKVAAEEGQAVVRGQLLAQLDDSTLLAQTQAARARAAGALAQLAKMRQPTRRQDLLSAEAALAQAEANFQMAEDTWKRVKALREEGGVSDAELVSREMQVGVARAGVEQARQRLSLAREGSRAEDLRLAEAQAAEAQASVRQMEAMLAQTRVVAPDAGLIVRRDAHLGDVSTVGRALFQLVRANRLEVEALVPETDLGRLKVGQLVQVSSDARPDLRATGRVRMVGAQVDANSRQATVKIALEQGSEFKAGMFVRAAINLGALKTLAVLSRALITTENGSQVFVLENGVAKTRSVQPGLRAGDWVAIDQGLKAGEPVIIAGVGFLKDGDAVNVAPALQDESDTPSSDAPEVEPSP
jgi:HlyD family secretion protein